MGFRQCYTSAFSSIPRRSISSNEPTTAGKLFRQSPIARFIESRRKRVQEEDIRLEPYLSKGVYTESGAIRPVSLPDVAFVLTFLLSITLDAKTISTWPTESSSHGNTLSLSGLVGEQVRSSGSGEDGSIRLQR